MSTLYQKYRPQKFNDLIGQEHIVQTITNEIKNCQTVQAYLFYGARGIGKTTIARLLAKSLNCSKRQPGEFEPCQQCPTCLDISAGRHIDVIEIDAASHTGVDNVRENIIENAQFKPSLSPFKIFIIDEVHMLSNNAFNALLKILEEPPKHIIFILATTELHKLPSTIISRCERFNFKKMSFAQIAQRLNDIIAKENVKVDKKIIDRIINKSDGALRDAESLLGQILSLNLPEITLNDAEIILPSTDIESLINFIESLLNSQCALALDLLERLVNEGVNLEEFAYDLIEIMRVMMIIQQNAVDSSSLGYSEQDYKKITKLAKQISPELLIKLIEETILRKAQIKQAPIAQLPLEILAVKFGSNRTVPDETVILTAQPLPANSPAPIAKPKKLAKIKEKITELTSRKPIKTSLEEVREHWDEITKNIAKQNHSLGFLLKMTELDNLETSGKLTLSVQFSIHKEKLEETKNRKLFEEQLTEIFKEKIKVDYLLKEAGDSEPIIAKDLADVAADFGGEVIG
ncbi:MAG: hypothetical protein COU31_02975 [Candidatus Magasanikbacteria bacterium CG10_big_fil_rev_8_21_14_0_10_40_10]|uniref:DNA polymerase III subunit gamma/tau n=1 Tax=Candidatus Magasanikbacteria bacterium CG10_big_fil_rev_8_21_14_0_10_40_10 TaxID=1974648 RepID=A0A2M6W3Q3_9BACT|nr:MAG: hypothetical protein COU31_02975 [Candidatus Magasanikbacteria bacterium CG10_big_fil_rev_8_21_14_0_10_40_10]